MEHFGKKVKLDGYTFDSQKEAQFYQRFIKDCGHRYKVHPSYPLLDKCLVGGYDMKAHGYRPDFVVYDGDEVAHVYDVKTSLDNRAVDASAKLRFAIFARRYGVPVEVVVPRKNDFKTKLFDYSNAKIQKAHAKRDVHGNVKTYKNGHVKYAYYDVHESVEYDIHDTIGF